MIGILGAHIFLLQTLVVLNFIIPSGGLSKEKCAVSDTMFNCVSYVKNYDADTITFNIKGVHPIIGKNINIRVKNIDSPEIRTRDKCEKELVKLAKEFVKERLSSSSNIVLSEVERGKYFRLVANVIIDGESLAEILLENKFAVTYDGNKKPNVDWCKLLKSRQKSE